MFMYPSQSVCFKVEGLHSCFLVSIEDWGDNLIVTDFPPPGTHMANCKCSGMKCMWHRVSEKKTSCKVMHCATFLTMSLD